MCAGTTNCKTLVLFAAFAGVAWGGTVGKDGGRSGAFTYSADTSIAAVQHAVKAVVERYQRGLNSSNFAIIRPLFAPDAVAEWNDKATVIGRDAMAAPYEALFKEINSQLIFSMTPWTFMATWQSLELTIQSGRSKQT